MAVACETSPKQWTNPVPYSWASWQHVMPYLSFEELFLLSQVEYLYPFVDMHLSTGQLVIDGAYLRDNPTASNIGFYKHIGRVATQLAVVDTIQMDIAPLLACFPHLQTLTLRRVLIPQTVINGFPGQLRKLILEDSQIRSQFMQKWCIALSKTLHSVEFIRMNEGTAKILMDKGRHLRLESMAIKDFKVMNPRLKSLQLKHIKIGSDGAINCPIEYLAYGDADIENLNGVLKMIAAFSTTALFKVDIFDCDTETVDLLLRFPNLKHLTVQTPIGDQMKWSYMIKNLKGRLETFKYTCAKAPIEVLPDEIFVKITGYLDTEDWIALTHVNRKMRSIIFENVYPIAEVKLRLSFKRYPLESRPYIFIELGLRVQKLKVSGRGKTNIFNEINFPKLTSLKVSTVHIGEAQKVPNGLEVLHVHNYGCTKTSIPLFARTLPHITDLHWDTTTSILPFEMTLLRKFDGFISLEECLQVLRNNYNLTTFDVEIGVNQNGSINDLMEAFKCTTEITDLCIYLIKEPITFTDVLIQPILPQLKELVIEYEDDSRAPDAVRYFLKGLCATKLRTLKVHEESEEIFRFKNLRTLWIVNECVIYAIADIIQNLPKLETLTTAKNKLTLAEGVRLIEVLESSQRTIIIFNGVKLRSYSDLLAAHDVLNLNL